VFSNNFQVIVTCSKIKNTGMLIFLDYQIGQIHVKEYKEDPNIQIHFNNNEGKEIGMIATEY
jgi:hypothetical protein